MRRAAFRLIAAGLLGGLFAAMASAQIASQTLNDLADAGAPPANPVLEWNQIFVDALIATSPPNIASPRLGAIVHAAVFDAYNGVDRRYTPLFVEVEDLTGAISSCSSPSKATSPATSRSTSAPPTR